MSEQHQTEHSSLIKTPKQLAIVVVLAFVVPVVVIIVLAQLAVGTKKSTASPAAQEEAIAKRLKPAGEVIVVAAGGAQQLRDGKAVVETACPRRPAIQPKAKAFMNPVGQPATLPEWPAHPKPETRLPGRRA